MQLDVRKLTGEDLCAGAEPGRVFLAQLIALTGDSPSLAEPLIIDFKSVTVATASFLRESVFALRALLRSKKSNFYPVVANANAIIRDELGILMPYGGDALLSCSIENTGVVTNVHLIGRLDEKQKSIFDLITSRGETDAGALQREFGAAEGVQQTAWNNRLSGLASLGLIVEVNRGRAKRYHSLLKENEGGH